MATRLFEIGRILHFWDEGLNRMDKGEWMGLSSDSVRCHLIRSQPFIYRVADKHVFEKTPNVTQMPYEGPTIEKNWQFPVVVKSFAQHIFGYYAGPAGSFHAVRICMDSPPYGLIDGEIYLFSSASLL